MNTKTEEPNPSRLHTIISSAADRVAASVFILPTVLALLFLSIFPLIASLYVSLAKFDIGLGGAKFTFVGLKNYSANTGWLWNPGSIVPTASNAAVSA